MEGMHLYGPAIGPVWRGGCIVGYYSRAMEVMHLYGPAIGPVWRGGSHWVYMYIAGY